jgi:DNA modification methylase/transcription elongation factor Elf1
MEKIKLTKNDLDKVRDIEGFPIGRDEDIIALSDAPYYTACPNPMIKGFLDENGSLYSEENDTYSKEPFSADVSEGKTDPIYMAHAYHTKVPYKAILKYILHYTNPGDVVLDGFCGSGMTGIAAQMCGQLSEEEKAAITRDIKNVEFGSRKAILSDLSPIASFISSCFNNTPNSKEYIEDVQNAIDKCKEKYSWMFKTRHLNNDGQLSMDSGSGYGEINYTVWSDVLICPSCGKEIVLWDAAVDLDKKKIKDTFFCKSCGAELKKKDCEKAKTSYFDDALNEVCSIVKQVPVQINYTYHGKRYDKVPDQEDYDLLNKIENYKLDTWYPHDRMCEGREARRNDSAGITHVHQFYTKRNLIVLAEFINSLRNKKHIITATASMQRSSKLYKYTLDHKFGTVTGTLYIPSLGVESSLFSLLSRKSSDIEKAFNYVDSKNDVIVQCCSTTDLRTIPDNSIDYIFTDPPFGSNIDYSELSYMWEVWLKVKTNILEEAIINDSQKKNLHEYQELMTRCFKEYYRVLKPNRWMTVEFHNSKNAVWNAIQESLLRAGFIVADVRTLDKKQGSFKQVNTNSAVKQDLVISTYKPKDELIREMHLQAGNEETAWAFVRQHLANISKVVENNGKIEIISERQAFLLFDRMVAYHVANGIPVPIDASDFYKGLNEKFMCRDGMYFLPDQVNEYDNARIKADLEPVQLEFIVTNEKTAIGWLYQQLATPQKYADIQPKFMQQVKAIDKYESIPELAVILEENFLQNEDGKWYVPDITKEGDVAKLREKKLVKEFESYMQSKGKLKLFRSEAIRAGFSMLWKDKNYQAIVDMAQRLPEQTIQEDQNLLMYYDISLSRI